MYATFVVAVLAVLTFVPFKFVHPFRVVRLRALTVAALVLWCVLAVHALVHELAPGPWTVAGLVAIALYFVALGPIDQLFNHDRPAV